MSEETIFIFSGQKASTPGNEQNKEKQNNETNIENGNIKGSVMSSVRKFSAASSPTNGSIAKNDILHSAKSPVLRSLTNKNNRQASGERRSPPGTAPKPRPWSMATDRKSGMIINF